MTAMVTSVMDWGEGIVWTRVRGLSLAVWAFVISGLCSFVGLLWDGAWHASFGRDTFWIPPHDLMYGGITLSMGMAVAILVTGSRRPRDPNLIGIGPLQAPLGIWIAMASMVLMFSAAAYDDWWHNHIGHVEGDLVLWSPPHFLGVLGALGTLVGAVLFQLTQISIPTRADGKPLWIWESLDSGGLALILCFSYVSFLVAALSLDRYEIYDKLRFDGSLYPILALILGPALIVIAQRVTNRAGTATFSFILGFVLAALVAFVVKNLFGFPKAAGLPIMALFGALFLDIAFHRFGRGYKWLLWAGPVFVLIFYLTEYLWAWYLTRYPWWPIDRTLVMIPVGVVVGTASLFLGAFVAGRLERAGWIRHVTIPSSQGARLYEYGKRLLAR